MRKGYPVRLKPYLTTITSIVGFKQKSEDSFSPDTLAQRLPVLYPDLKFSNQIIEELKSMDLISSTPATEEYHLTRKGTLFATEAYKDYTREAFNKVLEATETSPTYSKYRELAYGKDLGQHNAIPMDQLYQIVEILDIDSGMDILDLGCGIGGVTKFIAEITGGNVLGLDISDKAIEIAKEKAISIDNLRFELADIDHLDLMNPRSFDIILLLDSIYFVIDEEDTITNLLQLLKPEGVIALTYTKINTSSGGERLGPSETDLGNILVDNNLKYHYVDLTNYEISFWQGVKEAVINLKDEFEKENNMGLYHQRIDEANYILTHSNDICRYLYIIPSPQNYTFRFGD